MKRKQPSENPGSKSGVSKCGKFNFNAARYDPKSFNSIMGERGPTKQTEPYTPQYLVCTRQDGESFQAAKPSFFVEHLE